MIIVLSFFIFIITFIGLGLIFAKVKIKVKDLNFQMTKKSVNQNEYFIEVGVFLYGKIKLLGINFQNSTIKFLGKKIELNSNEIRKIYNVLEEPKYRNVEKKFFLEAGKKLDIKLEKFNLKLSLGTDSTLITSFLIFAVSTVVSIILQKSITKYNPKKHSFIITPKYENYNLIDIKFNTILSFKLIKLIKMVILLNKENKVKPEIRVKKRREVYE